MSNDFQPSDAEYCEATSHWSTITPLVQAYTVGIMLGGMPKGTAILVMHKERKILLTAHHVAIKLISAQAVGLILKFDGDLTSIPTFSSTLFKVTYWNQDFETALLSDTSFKFSDKVKDLSFLELADSIVRFLDLHKSFYPISDEDNIIITENDPLVTTGIIKYGEKEINAGPFSMVKSQFSYSFDNGVEYIVCPVKNDTYEILKLGMSKIQNLSGLSGGGLWKIIRRDQNGIDVKLVGIGIAQRLEDGAGELIFHGPKSLFSFLNNYHS